MDRHSLFFRSAIAAGVKNRGVRCMQECGDIGPHYAVTLRAWRAAWERERCAILALGYSERHWRKFRCSIRS